MGNERARPDANNCFVCGPTNPVGLQIDFRMDGDVCRAAFTPGENHVGWENMLHGGIMYSALDDVMDTVKVVSVKHPNALVRFVAKRVMEIRKDPRFCY